MLTELERRFRDACFCYARWNDVASEPSLSPPLRLIIIQIFSDTFHILPRQESFASLAHTNPTRQRGPLGTPLAGASGSYELLRCQGNKLTWPGRGGHCE